MPPTPDRRFFCFRGFMKSGTNWVGNLLNLHPRISCVGELHLESLYQTLQRDLRQLPIMRDARARRIVREQFQEMVCGTLIRLGKPDAIVFGERTPHTLAPLVIKGAAHITITRDARDVLISRMFHLYNFPEVSRVFDRFPAMKERLARFREDPWYFREHPDQLLDNEEVVRESMKWWRDHHESDRRTIALHPGLRVLAVRYEDFHRDLEGVRRLMYGFLDLDPREAAAVPPALGPSLDQERPHEFNRKGQIGDWKNYMTAASRRWINDECGDELRRQGYITSPDW